MQMRQFECALETRLRARLYIWYIRNAPDQRYHVHIVQDGLSETIIRCN